MSDAGPFPLRLRGYDPAQVDRHVTDLATALEEERAAAADLAFQVQALEQSLVERATQDAAELVRPEALTPSYADLGHRVAQILSLTEEEALDLLARAQGRRRGPAQRGGRARAARAR